MLPKMLRLLHVEHTFSEEGPHTPSASAGDSRYVSGEFLMPWRGLISLFVGWQPSLVSLQHGEPARGLARARSPSRARGGSGERLFRPSLARLGEEEIGPRVKEALANERDRALLPLPTREEIAHFIEAQRLGPLDQGASY